MAEIRGGSPSSYSYEVWITSSGGGSEGMESWRGNSFYGDQNWVVCGCVDGGSVDAPPAIGAPAVEEEGRVGSAPAGPAGVVDEEGSLRPIMCSDKIDAGVELLDLAGPWMVAGGGDGGPEARRRDGGAEVGGIRGRETAGEAGWEVGGVDGGPTTAGVVGGVVGGDIDEVVAGEGGAVDHCLVGAVEERQGVCEREELSAGGGGERDGERVYVRGGVALADEEEGGGGEEAVEVDGDAISEAELVGGGS